MDTQNPGLCEIDLPEIVSDAVFRAMQEIRPVIREVYPNSPDPVRGLETCSALMTSILLIAEARYGADGVTALMER